MAKIVVEFDTKTKDIKATKDGVPVDFQSFSFYSYKDDDGDMKGTMNMDNVVADDDEGTYTRTSVYADVATQFAEAVLKK